LIENRKLQGKFANIDKTNVRPESGLTWRSMLGLLYTIAIVQPAVIWIYLATNSMVLAAASYASIYVLSELFNIAGKPLTKQEILVFWVGSQLASAGAAGSSLIFNLYYRRHPLVTAFHLTTSFPEWFAPAPYISKVWDLRLLIHSDWMLPILVVAINMLITAVVVTSLGFIGRDLYVVREKLPFPIQQVTAQLCSTLSKRERGRLEIFAIFATASLVYSFIQYGVPTLADAIFDWPVKTIPLPWLDLNYIMERILPGASFGVGTDLSTIAIALVLPSQVIVSILIGSAAVYVIGNAVLVSLGIFTEWTPGMTVQGAWSRSMLHFWTGPSIIVAIAAGLLPMIFSPRPLIESFQRLIKPAETAEKGFYRSRVWMLVFAGGAIASIAFYHLLAPDVPILIPIFLVLWTFILTLASARILGVTGIAVNVPHAYQSVLLASGYGGVSGWLVTPPGISGGVFEGAQWCAYFKLADLTETDPTDLVKTLAIVSPLALVCGVFFAQMFWTLAPIPSNLFPCPAWDVSIIMSLQFVTKQITLFNWTWLVGTFIIGVVIQALAIFTHLPISLAGIAAGFVTPMPYSISQLFALIFAKILQWRLGKEWFARNRLMMAAGLLVGQGFVTAFSAAVAIVFKSMWVEVY